MVRALRIPEAPKLVVIFKKIFTESFAYYPPEKKEKTLRLWTKEKEKNKEF